MDLKKLSAIVDFYKKHYKEIRLRENYKWEAAAEFKRADVMKAQDFPAALKEGLSGTGNLLDSGFYYPKTNLLLFLKKDQEYLRQMFVNLYNEDTDVKVRTENFMKNAATMQRKYFSATELSDNDQDEHAVSVYLFLQYPEKYYIYRYTVFRAFAREIDYSYIPPRKSDRNLPEYHQFCEALRKFLMKDKELMELEEERHRTYQEADPAYHLLTQDILICGTTYFRHAGLFGEKGKAIRADRFRLKPVKQEVTLEAIPFYDPVEIVKYETGLSDEAEKFILRQEQIKVTSYRIAARKQPVLMSAGEGRGKGYDILSYNRHGEQIFITVKATAGAEDESFTVSEAERKKSTQVPDRYYLYRVFRFSQTGGTGEYSVWHGDLTPLCQNKDRYRVILKEK